MSEVVVISTSCDVCHKQTPLQDICWNLAHTEALCPVCYESLGEAPEEPQNVNPVPIYVFYDQEGTVLHVSTDLSTPNMWKDTENWWGYKVEWIAVRHFDGPDQALAAKRALSRKLAPKFGDEPTPADPTFVDTDFNVFDIEVSDETKEALDQIVNVRVSKEISTALTKIAKKRKVERSQLLRSILYETVRQAENQEALGF